MPVKNSGELQWKTSRLGLLRALGKLATLRTFVRLGMKFSIVERGWVILMSSRSIDNFIVTSILHSILKIRILVAAMTVIRNLACWNCYSSWNLGMLTSSIVVHIINVLSVVRGIILRTGLVMIRIIVRNSVVVTEQFREAVLAVSVIVDWSLSADIGTFWNSLVVMPIIVRVCNLAGV